MKAGRSGLAMAAALLWGTAANAADFHATKEMHDFAAAVAPPTAAAKIRGGENSEKALTLGRIKDGALGVTSLQIIGSEPTAPLTVVAGTIAVIIVHHPGQCDAPSGDDDAAARQQVATIVASSNGTKLWEIGREKDVISIRAITGSNTFGPWEPFQRDGSKYTSYACSS